MKSVVVPGMYITAKTLRRIDNNTYTLLRQHIRELGYAVSDSYGSYIKRDINEEDTIRLHDDGDLVWSTINNSQKVKGAYELTYQEIVNLLDITPIAEACDVSNIDDLTIVEIAKHIQQMTSESNKLNETLLVFKQALIKKLL